MQAKLRIDSSLGHLLSYHEDKVQEKKAECILAENFIKDLADLTVKDKTYHFKRLSSLNERVIKPYAHLTIDFHPSDQLNNDKLIKIAKEFMLQMGLDKQPYLVYRHDDAYHPHIHLVSQKIKPNGRVIKIGPKQLRHMHQIVRDLETVYHLVPLGASGIRQDPSLPAKRIIYGKMPSYAAVNQVLQTVVFGYTYTSLNELNAALRLYNVEAYTGKTGSRLEKYKGLVYRILQDGKSKIMPIRASRYSGKPTLKVLEQRFIENSPLQEQRKARMMVAIERTFYGENLSLDAFKKEMANKKIAVVFKENQVFYVDHNQKAIFEGESLGAAYTADRIKTRCVSEQEYHQIQEKIQQQQQEQNLGLHL